jgi:hypothetical protein
MAADIQDVQVDIGPILSTQHALLSVLLDTTLIKTCTFASSSALLIITRIRSIDSVNWAVPLLLKNTD